MEQIGKYRLEAEIGRGGFGRVYRAFDPTVGRTVAIKVLLAGGDHDLLTRFRNEANATGKLHHRNIVTIHDYGEFEGTPYLVMEFLEGQDLQDVLVKRRPLTVLDKISIMAQVAEGLHHAHLKGIVHRDVKPANMMLLGDGTVKVMDFGIARLVRESATRLTQTGNLIGTISHMAPEQFQGGEVDQLCDIFAYGLIYYELLTGKHPFKAGDPAATIYNITSRNPEGILAAAPDCPAALEQIVLRALSKDREMRYQSLEDLQFDVAPIRLELQSRAAENLLESAERSFAANRAEDAQRLVREALQLDPNNARARGLHDNIRRASQGRAAKERFSKFIEAGRKELGAANYPKAIESFEAALKVDTGNTEASELLKHAREASQRAQRAASLLADARRDLAAQNLTNAYRSIAECLQIAPASGEAAMLMAAVKTEIERRERERRYNESIVVIESLAASGAFDEALARIADLETFYPGLPQIRQMAAGVHYAKQEYERKQQLSREIAGARQLVSERRWRDAVTFLSSLERQYPGEQEIAALLAYSREELRVQERAEDIERIVREAQGLIERREFARVENLIAGGLYAYPGDSALERMRDRALTARTAHERDAAVEAASRQAEHLLAQKRFSDAISEIDKATSSYDARDLQELRKRAEAQRREHERAERLGGTLSSLRALLDQGRLEEAIESARRALSEYPEEAQLRSLTEKAEGRLAQRRKTKRIDAALQEAREHAKRFAFDDALNVLQEAIGECGPDDSLLRLKAEIDEQRRRRILEEAVARATAEARRRRDAGQFDEAVEALERAALDHPGEASIKDLLTELRGERSYRNAVGAVIRSATTLLEREQFEAGIAALAQGLREFPGEPRLLSAWNEAERAKNDFERGIALRVARERVDRLLADNRLDEAAEALEQALRRLPGEVELVTRLTAVHRRIEERSAISEARELLDAGKLREALEKLAQDEARFPDSTELRALSSFAEETLIAQRRVEEVDAATREGAVLLEQSRVAEAVVVLEKALQKHPEDAALAALLGQAKGNLAELERAAAIDGILHAARSHAAKKQFAQALQTLERGLQRHKDQPAIAALLESTRAESAGHERAMAISAAVKRAEAALTKKRPAEALQVLAEFSNEPAVREIRQRADHSLKRSERLEELRGLSKTVRGASNIAGLGEIGVAVAELLSSYQSDSEFQEAAASVRRAIEARSARLAAPAPSPPREPAGEAAPAPQSGPKRRWGYAAGIAAAIGVIAIGIYTARREEPKPEIPAIPRAVSPKILEFYATQPVISPGQTAQLCYSVENAKAARLDPAVATIAPASRNCVAVTPASSTEYKLIAVGADNTETFESVRITVQDSPSAIGTLAIQTQMEGVSVFIDGRKYGRMTEKGELRLPLDAKEYLVRVEKQGYQSPPPGRVEVVKDRIARLSFRLEPKPAILAVAGAPPGIQVLLDGKPLGAVQGGRFTVPPGRHVVEFVKDRQPLKRHTLNFEPDSVVSLKQEDIGIPEVAEVKQPVVAPPPDLKEVEARQWEQIQNSRDTGVFDQHLRTFPNGVHTAMARQRIEQLEWESARGKRDPTALHTITGKYRAEALELIKEIERERLIREAEIAKVEQAKRDEAAIVQTLNQLARAYESKDAGEIGRIWQGISGAQLDQLRGAFKNARSVSVQFRLLEKPQISGDTAVVKCERTSQTILQNVRPGPPDKETLTIGLRRSGGGWVIQTLAIPRP